MPGVAFLSGEILLGADGMQVHPRLRPLRLPHPRSPDTGAFERTAVVYVEIARQYRAPLGSRRIAKLAQRIRALPLVRDAHRLQLNFEAVESRRADWYALVASLRSQMPATQQLDVTALADWCMHEEFAPSGVDRVVPMLYSLGPFSPALARVLDGTSAFPAKACRDSIGVTADALLSLPPDLILGSDRLYVFESAPWDAQRYERLVRSLSELVRGVDGTAGEY